MPRKFNLSNNWYGDFKIFNKKCISINEGLTILVGCNGAGKTTMLMQIESQLRDKNIPVLKYNNLHDGERKLKEKSLHSGDFVTLAKTVISSEGENIINCISFVANDIGKMVRDNQNSDEYWILLDAVDSGLSIDNIIELKRDLIKYIISIEKHKTFYFVVSANSYEMARDENCFDVMNGKYVKFKDYDDYRNFITESRIKKNKRLS